MYCLIAVLLLAANILPSELLKPSKHSDIEKRTTTSTPDLEYPFVYNVPKNDTSKKDTDNDLNTISDTSNLTSNGCINGSCPSSTEAAHEILNSTDGKNSTQDEDYEIEKSDAVTFTSFIWLINLKVVLSLAAFKILQ